MKSIIVKVIPHSEQRYETVGDWWTEPDGTWQIRVSELGDWRYEFLVAFHEILEMAWCAYNNVSQMAVDKFDMEYEDSRKMNNNQDPGDSPDAPYYMGHQVATIAEHVAALTLGVLWKEYEEAINNL